MKKNTPYLLTLIGLFVMVAGLVITLTIELSGWIQALPYLAIGLGSGAFGHGLGEIFSRQATKKYPDAARQLEIERNDERNVAIGNRAKAKAYDWMLYLFGALMLVFAILDVDLFAILLLVFVYLFIVGVSIYYRCKYEKEM